MASDLYVSYFMEDNPNEENYFSFGFDTPRGVDGLTKLLTLYLKDLFTAAGSDIYDTEAGTKLPFIIGGNVGDFSEVEDIVSSAVLRAGDNVIRLQSAQRIPRSEQFGSAEILSLTEAGAAGVAVSIRLQNAEGASLIVSLPVG